MVQKVKLSANIWDRVLKWEFIHGCYFVPLGAACVVVTFLWPEHQYKVFGLFGALYMVLEGVYKLWHNPAKKQARIDSEAKKYMPPDGGGE